MLVALNRVLETLIDIQHMLILKRCFKKKEYCAVQQNSVMPGSNFVSYSEKIFATIIV